MQLHRPRELDDLNVDFFSGDSQNNNDSEKITEDMLPNGNISPIGSKSELLELLNDDFSKLDSFLEQLPDSDNSAANTKPSAEPETDFSQYAEFVPQEKTDEQPNTEHKMPKLPNKDSDEPYSKSEILEFLAEDFSALEEVKNDAPFTNGEQEKETEIQMKKRTPLVDEKTALESFPDLSDSIIDLAAKDDKQREKEILKRAREDAKISIENEKKKIKEQKHLEKTVQRPFGKRRAAVLLMIIFLLIGIVASAASGLIYAINKSENGLLTVSGVTLGYVDGDKIDSPNHLGKYILVKQGRIQGNDTLLFLYAGDNLTVADVIGFGDELYAVDMGDTVYRVAQTNILGNARFKTPNLTVVRNAVVGYPFIVFAVLAIYFILVISLSAMRIRKLNAVIKSLKESYELV